MFAVSSQNLVTVSRPICTVAISPPFVPCSLVVAATEASLGLLSELELDDSVVVMVKDDVPEIRRKVVADGVATPSAKKTVDQFGERRGGALTTKLPVWLVSLVRAPCV